MSKKVKLYKKKKECCGCGACEQICPENAINLEEDKEGFLYPVIDFYRCIGCGMCEKVCTIRNAEIKSDDVVMCYAGFAKNESVRMLSSSGGVFTLLAEEIFERQGIIVGAAFDDDWQVHHICIDNLKDLEKLRGSKYVQSRLEDTYRETKEYLEKGKNVLFTGVPCQISGLRRYLRKKYDNLYTVDVLCHGVPNPKLWNMYLKTHKERINKISFRSKDTGWKKFSLKIEFDNGEIYQKNIGDDIFMQMFLRELCLRPSCYDCKFKKLDRDSDITIGDSWGIENYIPEMDDDKGTSVIMVHSEGGMRLINSILGKMNYCVVERDKVLSPNADSRKSVTPHINRKKFVKNISNNANIRVLTKLLELSLWDRVRRKASKFFTRYR